MRFFSMFRAVFTISFAVLLLFGVSIFASAADEVVATLPLIGSDKCGVSIIFQGFYRSNGLATVSLSRGNVEILDPQVEGVFPGIPRSIYAELNSECGLTAEDDGVTFYLDRAQTARKTVIPADKPEMRLVPRYFIQANDATGMLFSYTYNQKEGKADFPYINRIDFQMDKEKKLWHLSQSKLPKLNICYLSLGADLGKLKGTRLPMTWSVNGDGKFKESTLPREMGMQYAASGGLTQIDELPSDVKNFVGKILHKSGDPNENGEGCSWIQSPEDLNINSVNIKCSTKDVRDRLFEELRVPGMSVEFEYAIPSSPIGLIVFRVSGRGSSRNVSVFFKNVQGAEFAIIDPAIVPSVRGLSSLAQLIDSSEFIDKR